MFAVLLKVYMSLNLDTWRQRRTKHAAAAIHTDLARGFIRAECSTDHELIEPGSEKKIKEQGKHRLEGKSYFVQHRQ